MQPGAIEMEGRRIGAYEVIRAIGSGGMGTVYLARRADKVFEKQVALKIVRSGQGPGDTLRRFARSDRSLHHWIIPISLACSMAAAHPKGCHTW